MGDTLKTAASKAPPAATAPALRVLASTGFPEYALLDSGKGRKLERFGRFTLDRPEPQAMWAPALDEKAWQRADAVFRGEKGEDEDGGGRWRTERALPETWPVKVLGVTMLCRLTGFRHVGLFPEQFPHWQWMQERQDAVRGERPRVLNLFAYTGAASLVAARAGAEVTHVDASKRAIGWAKQNQVASGMADAPIRWILEDARKFVAREVRRGRTYHVVLVDPPKFGRGPAGEVWDVFADLPALLGDCAALLAPRHAALVLTTYAIRASALATDVLVRERLSGRPGTTESGELVVIDEAAGRPLPTSLYTRWVSNDAAA
jgi:23S rRNA (cytosine1962-C5)-methyltransferase